ncbi:aromatic/alkene monooxygenase hydroxylase subunit beta [Methylibium sp. Root1272]|uniref:aromatic/alkene monooxygenase hydroxylase subunit beta n=1 Tax=Methylibium sp. Root1272 TaxID=1736441 RepID=UPI0006F24851|nr:aromatic/alkene monooxygenase hydroxylase subunit beta [Methylibium sp. Root1272]KQW66137.1 toluene hydroxylase [Methylibium sp. Root1272]
MSQATSNTTPETPSTATGAAGSARFAGWDSRKYNYFTPKGRKATHYEDMTLDVQPDPKRYLLQDWIMSFGNGDTTYTESWTAARSSDWHVYRSVDEEWERTHYQRQSTIVGMISQAIENARRSGAAQRYDKTWVKVLEKHLGAYKHAEFGLGTSLMHAQRYGYTQMINSAILTNSSYKLRFAQDITLYLGDIGLDIEGFDAEIGKTQWLEDPIWQPTRQLIEAIGGATDYLEKYFAVNVVFEPLIGELFRSGFFMQAAAAQNDFLTPTVVSSAEGDFQRNLANSVELFHMLTADAAHGNHNKALFADWLTRYGDLAVHAAKNLQPIWSLPRTKVAQFEEAYAAAVERMKAISQQIGVALPASLSA